MLCNIGLLGEPMSFYEVFPSPRYYTDLYPLKYPLAVAQRCTAFHVEAWKPLRHKDHVHLVAYHFIHTQ